MRKKRIDGALASIPVQNGQVLKGEHLAILREVLSAAINENKYDIDRIISAEPDAIYVYGEDTEDLDLYTSTNVVEDKTLGFLHTSYGVDMYEYNEGTSSWEYLGVLNLTELFNKTQELEQRVEELESIVDNNGFGTKYEDNDSILLPAVDQAHNYMLLQIQASDESLIGARIKWVDSNSDEYFKELYPFPHMFTLMNLNNGDVYLQSYDGTLSKLGSNTDTYTFIKGDYNCVLQKINV